MLTIVESSLFSKLWPEYWTSDEFGEFAAYISQNPEMGDVVPGSGGVRKMRWSRRGSGKRGGIRVIYFNRLERGQVVLLTLYAKSKQGNAPAHILKQMKEVMADD